jgi:membrane protease YdiL (CAAX protease family)
MNGTGPAGFWTTIRVLTGMALTRAAGRRRRRAKLFRNRSGGSGGNWSDIGFAITIVFMAALNVSGAFFVRGAVFAGERLAAEQSGQIVVDDWFLQSVQRNGGVPPNVRAEAQSLSQAFGRDPDDIAALLRQAVATGRPGLIARSKAIQGLRPLPYAGGYPAMLGTLALAWWFGMLILQGEGVELDTQRRRHPMWEWLLTHPVRPSAIFAAEMLSPLAANPIYYSAPLVPAILYGGVYGLGWGIAALFIIGLPLTLAASCMGKALEVWVMLRFAPRTRGAVAGMLGWVGYTATLLLFVAPLAADKIANLLTPALDGVATLPWPWLGWFLGQTGQDRYSFAAGAVACWLGSAGVIALAVALVAYAARNGLSATSDAPPKRRPGRFGREPLYRKELMWFARDRGAVVQAILVPLTMASFQLVSMGGLLARAGNSWNLVCGGAIIFGTYFLTILGPRSLTAEGSALWIALTWPRGLESLLKAKARLWTMLSTGLVAIVLAYAAYAFPADIPSIAAVGVCWFVFARSMAEKSVTLASVAEASGEAPKVPTGRRWATQLGTMTFAIGVLTEQWHLMIAGIVYSVMTAAAMWQSFRARLPFLFDPWSETVPAPPTLTNAMVAISILVEGAALATGIVAGSFGQEAASAMQAVIYTICAAAVSLGTWNFLNNRGVTLRDIWTWNAPRGALFPWLLAGSVAGLLLGLFGLGWTFALHRIPGGHDLLLHAAEQMTAMPRLAQTQAIMGIALAPLVEEYLFRGLLYRTLDQEWGGWAAILGSAAFFAIYHPVLFWAPVFLLGIASALLFRRSGYLAPPVLMHVIFNGTGLFW